MCAASGSRFRALSNISWAATYSPRLSSMTPQSRDTFARGLRLLLPASICLPEFETDSAPQQTGPWQTPYAHVQRRQELPTRLAWEVVATWAQSERVERLELQLASASF